MPPIGKEAANDSLRATTLKPPNARPGGGSHRGRQQEVVETPKERIDYARFNAMLDLHHRMEPSCGKDAKFHLYEYRGLDKKRYLGALCCRSEDVVQAGVVFHPELVIKDFELFDVRKMMERHKRLPTFLRRKDKFPSQDDESKHRKMLKGLRGFLENLRELGLCALLKNGTVLALDEEMYKAPALPQDPVMFLHTPAPLPPSATYPSQASRDPVGDRRIVPAASTTPQQALPLGTGGPNGLTPRYQVPSGDAGGGIGRIKCAQSNMLHLPLPSPPPPPPPPKREVRPDEYAAYDQLAGARVRQGSGRDSYLLHSPLPSPPPPSMRELRPDEYAAYGQFPTASSGFTLPQHMVAKHPAVPLAPLTHGQLEGLSPGWVGPSHGFRLGVWGMPPAPPMPLSVPQGIVQEGGGAAAGAGGSRAVAATPPGKRQSNVSHGARSAGGSSDEISATSPAPTGSPTFRTRVGNGSISIEQLPLRRKPSVNDSTFINLADKTHIWAFGAAAELIHNSSDAKATEVRVNLEDLGPERDTNFVVIDNGRGITHSEMAQMFALGKDYGYGATAPADERIGCNGFGFKQGVLRLGDTAVVVSVRGKVPLPDSPPEDIPTASFGILSIEAYRRSLETEGERQPVVVEYATLNLLTMQADERFNSQEEYDAAVEVIRRLVPYFTREYLTAYATRFVRHADGSALEISDIKSSTSIFVSRLKRIRNKLELIKDIGGTDIRLEDRRGKHARLPGRPKSCSSKDGLCPPMDYSLRSFCEQMFLEPKMKIFVQGSEVKTDGLLSTLEKEGTFAVDICDFLDEDDNGDPAPPYNIAVQVGRDHWHDEKGLSGIMVYFENCLVDAYARGQGLPSVVQENERGYLAIVAFSGSSDKKMFHPNPTKVGFPADNERYIYVLETAGEALTQVVDKLHVPNEMPLADDEEVDDWIACCECGKYRKVSKKYHDLNKDSEGWHCGIAGSPVPLPKKGSNKCNFPEDKSHRHGHIVAYHASAPVACVERPREVFSDDFILKNSNILGKGSSATVFAGTGYEGRAHALKVFKDEVTWRREKDILWALEKERKPHPNICSLAWICQEKLTLALKPLLPQPCSLSQYMVDSGNGTRPELRNHERLGIAEKVADALRHLHNREISHNDVKPSNIALGRNPKEDVLLVDFGQACKFSPKLYSSNTPLRYAPPEVLKGGSVSTKGECDMFGFGVTMVELFAGQSLFGPEAVRDGSKLRSSLRALAKLNNLGAVPFKDMKETLPGLPALYEIDGMKHLAKICRACVNGDTERRLTSAKAVVELAKFRGKAEFRWRHGTSIVYHTLVPGDRLHFAADGAFVRLTRLPGTSGDGTIKHHIKNGSKFDYRSRYISCSLTLSFCIFYAQKQRQMFSEEDFGLAPVLEIDLSKLGCQDLAKCVFDGTSLGRKDDDETALGPLEENFAADAEEVILIDIAVPREAVTAVYNLDFTQRPGESSRKHQDRVGQLQKLDDDLSRLARSRSSPFAEWDRKYRKFTRQKGNAKRSPLDQLKEQALVPNERGQLGAVLRASYCGRRRRANAGSRSGGIASNGVVGGGGASNALDGEVRGGAEDGGADGGADAGRARGTKRAQPEGGQPRPKAPKSGRVKN